MYVVPLWKFLRNVIGSRRTACCLYLTCGHYRFTNPTNCDVVILPVVVTKDLPISPRDHAYDFFIANASSALSHVVNQSCFNFNFTYVFTLSATTEARRIELTTSALLFLFFVFFHLTYPMGLNVAILPVITKNIPISPRFTPYEFLWRCKFSTLTTRQLMVEFYTYQRFPLRTPE